MKEVTQKALPITFCFRFELGPIGDLLSIEQRLLISIEDHKHKNLLTIAFSSSKPVDPTE